MCHTLQLAAPCRSSWSSHFGAGHAGVGMSGQARAYHGPATARLHHGRPQVPPPLRALRGCFPELRVFRRRGQVAVCVGREEEGTTATSIGEWGENY